MESEAMWSFATGTFHLIYCFAGTCMQVAGSISTLFSIMAQSLFVLWIYPILCVCLSPDGHVGYVHLLAIMNNATVNICIFV